MEYESPAHAPRFPYRLGIHGTVWGFGLSYSVEISNPYNVPALQKSNPKKNILSEKKLFDNIILTLKHVWHIT